jgi:hypothetical protein
MNQIVAVFNLKLPYDIINYICSFNFYSLDYSIKKVKTIKKSSLLIIKSLMREKMSFINYRHILIHNNSIQLQLMICRYCNNIIINQHILSKNSVCFCKIHTDRIIIPLLFDKYLLISI